MNNIQKMSQNILSNRLKLELGIALEANVDYHLLRTMSLGLRNDRVKTIKMMHVGNNSPRLNSFI